MNKRSYYYSALIPVFILGVLFSFSFGSDPVTALPITIPPVNNGNISDLSVYLGLSPGYSLIDKFGKNDDVDTSFEDIWNDGGVLTLLNSSSTMIITTTGQDTNGGTGAHTITISGLNGTYYAIEETVTLNAGSPPTTNESFIRINRAFVVDSGSSLTNENDIVITATTGGSVQGNIQSGEGQTQKTQYTIPEGFTGYLISGYFTTDSGQHVNGQLLVKNYNESWRVKHETIILDGIDRFNLMGSSPIPAKSDIKWRAIGASPNNEITAGYNLILKEN